MGWRALGLALDLVLKANFLAKGISSSRGKAIWVFSALTLLYNAFPLNKVALLLAPEGVVTSQLRVES